MIASPAILKWMWGAFGVYWLVAPRGTKQTEVSESVWFRVLRLGILLITFALLLSPWLRMGWLGRRFAPEAAIGREAGLTLTVAGLLLCIWARRTLGDYWSDKVALKVDHQLIRHGPYAHLRHPYFVKAKREDRILASRFGESFAEYKRQAGFLMPRW